MNELTCNFFAILTDGQLRKINLTQDITTEVRRAFIDHAGDLSDNGLDQIEFEGNYVLDKGEIFFVSMELDPAISEAVRDAFGIQELNLGVDMIKTLFWFEDNVYYFQNFDSRKLLSNKKVLCYSNNTYHKLTNDAFILDNHVDGIYRDDKFYFIPTVMGIEYLVC